MKYSRILTILTAIATTQAFSSGYSPTDSLLSDEAAPASRIITYLKSEYETAAPGAMEYEKALKIIRQYPFAVLWGDGKLHGKPNEAFFSISVFNYSNTLFLTQPLNTKVNEQIEKVSRLRQLLNTAADESQFNHIKRAIARQEGKLAKLYEQRGKEIEGFKMQVICRLGSLLKTKKVDTVKRASHSAALPVERPLNKPLEHLKKGW